VSSEKRARQDSAFSLLIAHAYLRLVRLAYRLLYRELAWSYDGVAWLVSGGLWRRWALAPLPALQGRVLELGFGTGHVQLALAARPAVVGLDASPQMAALAAARLRRAGSQPRLARGLAQALPFADASFDTVLATFPAEYILDPTTHGEILRVLAPGGRLVVLPLAQLDSSPYAALVDLAYRLTLQRPPGRAASGPLASRLPIAGMRFTERWVPVGASRALLLVGTTDHRRSAAEAGRSGHGRQHDDTNH
jgi:ubiquinone/menaquinone biosynthesis C-methylase UbiE